MCSPHWPGTLQVDQTGPKCTKLCLPLPPRCWYYRRVLPHLDFGLFFPLLQSVFISRLLHCERTSRDHHLFFGFFFWVIVTVVPVHWVCLFHIIITERNKIRGSSSNFLLKVPIDCPWGEQLYPPFYSSNKQSSIGALSTKK